MPKAAVAALAAGWETLKKGAALRRAPNRLWSTPITRGTGDVPDGRPVMVEIFLNGTWVNVSAGGHVLASDRVNVTKGQSSEGSEATAGRCDFTLKNNAANSWAFSAGNPASPYWSYFERGARVRISVPSGNDKSYRFQGEISDLEEDADTSGNHGTVHVQASGILDRLSRGEHGVRSPLYREITTVDPAGLRTYPVAYWPMEDAEGAQSLTNANPDGRPMFFNGDPPLAAGGTWPCSDLAPNITGTKFVAVIDPYPWSTTVQSSSECWFLMYAPSTITANMVIMRWATTYHTIDFEIPSSNNVRIRIYRTSDGTNVYDSGSLAVTWTATPLWFSWFMSDLPSSDNTSIKLYYQGMNSTDGLTSIIDTTVGAGERMKPFGRVQINPNGIASEVYIAHVAIFNHRQGDSANVGTPYFPSAFVLSGFEDERADVRFARILTEEGITHEVFPALTDHPLGGGVKRGVGEPMGVQPSGTLMNLLRECEAADHGMIYEMTSDFGLGYRTLQSLTNQSVTHSADHSLNELNAQPNARRDLSRVKNDVTMTRSTGNGDGSSYRKEDTTSKMSVHDNPNGVGRFENGDTVNVPSDDDLGDQAGWVLHLGTVNEPRYDNMTVELSHPTFTTSDTKRISALSVSEGDRIAVINTPDRVSVNDISQIAIGFEEQIDQFTHKIRWNCIPEAPFKVVVLDDSSYDTLDSSGTYLAESASASDTSLSIEWDSVSHVGWSTDDEPYDIEIDGERITVTTMTGTTSPQTATVTRSVNGVSKAHSKGAQVRLFTPLYLDM